MTNILELINDGKWDDAIKNMNDIFESVSEGKNLFHIACIRGNKNIIKEFLNTKSYKLILSDNDGNNGCHLLALNGWSELLLYMLEEYPDFLKYRNNNNKFIHNLVINNYNLLDNVLSLIDKHNYNDYLDFMYIDNNNNNRIFLYDIIDIVKYDPKYYNILKKLNDMNVNFNTLYPNSIVYIIEHHNPDLAKKILLEFKNIDYNMIDNYQNSILIWAISMKYENIIDILIDKNVDLNFSCRHNKHNPLSTCFSFGMFIEKLITNEHIDFNKRDNLLNIPLMYMLFYIKDNKSVLKHKKIKSLCDIVINKSDLFSLNIYDKSPLYYIKKYKLFKNFEEIISKKIPKDILELFKKNKLNKMNNLIKKNILNNSKLLLPDILKKNVDGNFYASSYNMLLYFMCLIEKYSNAIFPFQYPNSEKYSWYDYKLHTFCSYDEITFSLIQYIMTFSSMGIYFIDKEKYYIDKQQIFHIKRMMRCNKYRYIILHITIANQSFYHANIAIYDKIKNEVIRFEPYGDIYVSDGDYLDNLIKLLFEKSLNKSDRHNLKYIKPSDYLNTSQFQNISSDDDITIKNTGDPSGFCAAWCLWFVELVILNPDVDIKTLVNDALLYIFNTNKDDVISYIRQYSKHIVFEKNKLWKEFGLKLNLSDRKIYDSETSNVIKTNVDKKIINILNNL